MYLEIPEKCESNSFRKQSGKELHKYMSGGWGGGIIEYSNKLTLMNKKACTLSQAETEGRLSEFQGQGRGEILKETVEEIPVRLR